MATEANSDVVLKMDDILEEFMVNVTASTPEHLTLLCHESGMFNNRQAIIQFIGICIFSSAVNKEAVSNALMKEKFQDVRPVINAKFSVNGAVNMTALNLAGHCFLTKSMCKKTKFGRAWGTKLGQDNLWAGSLDGGQLSELQRKILKEKAAKIPKESAKAFADTFFQNAGLATAGSVVEGGARI